MAEHPARRMLGERPLPSDPSAAVVTPPPPPGSDYGTSGKVDVIGRPRTASPTQDSLPPGALTRNEASCLLGRAASIRVSFPPRFALPERLKNGEGAATAGISAPNFRESGLARTAN